MLSTIKSDDSYVGKLRYGRRCFFCSCWYAGDFTSKNKPRCNISDSETSFVYRLVSVLYGALSYVTVTFGGFPALKMHHSSTKMRVSSN